MKIAVCDDNSIYRDLAVDQIREHLSRRYINYEIFKFDSGIDLLYDVEEGNVPDIVFLDIYMDRLLGIDAARKLREKAYKGDIIFLSATADYAVDSYDVSARGYLLKPYSYEKLCLVLDRAIGDIDDKIYTILRRSDIIRIPYSDILYVDSCNTKCFLHCIDQTKYVLYKRLDEIENELNDNRFLRSHKSYLVNMDHIREAGKSFVLTNGDIALIRQRQLKEIKKAYMEFLDRHEDAAHYEHAKKWSNL